MIYFPLTKIVDSSEAVVAPGANITAEGQALIRVTAAPAQGVTPSLGASGELFAGFSLLGVSQTWTRYSGTSMDLPPPK